MLVGTLVLLSFVVFGIIHTSRAIEGATTVMIEVQQRKSRK